MTTRAEITEVRQMINREYGFQIGRIELLELSRTNRGYDYVMFRVCNIEYQMTYNNNTRQWELSIYDSNGRII